MTGPGDIAGVSSFPETRMPLCVKLGNADLFCLLAFGSNTDVSTRREPGRPVNVAGGVVLIGFEFGAMGSCRLAVMRASNEVGPSFGSLSDRGRPSMSEGLLSWFPCPTAPGSSVWMKQQRFPYGQDPETQNV